MELKNIEKKLTIFATILTILLILSFLPIFNFQNNAKIQKSAILNPRYKKEISKIELNSGENSLLLQKNASNENWFGQTKNSSSPIIFPVEINLIEEFLENCTKIQNFTKISNTKSGIEKMFLEDAETSDFSIIFKDKNNNKFSEILFNLKNAAQYRIYLRSEENLNVFEITSAEIYQFLTTVGNFWCDPFIIPQNVFGKISENQIQSIQILTENSETLKISHENYQKLISLRHAQIFDNSTDFNNEISKFAQIKIDLGDMSTIFIDVFPFTDKLFLLKYSFYPGANSNLTAKNLNYTATVSSWTLQQILELAN